jgi:hypothetical protein
VIQIDVGHTVGQGPKEDWHVNHQANGSGGTDPRHHIHLYCCVSDVYVFDDKNDIQAQHGGFFTSIVDL